MEQNNTNTENSSASTSPTNLRYKCARCRISVADVDEWDHHFETCPARAHGRVPASQYAVDDDDNESLHSHTSIYVDTEVDMEVRWCKCTVCPKDSLQVSPTGMVDRHVVTESSQQSANSGGALSPSSSSSGRKLSGMCLCLLQTYTISHFSAAAAEQKIAHARLAIMKAQQRLVDATIAKTAADERAKLMPKKSAGKPGRAMASTTRNTAFVGHRPPLTNCDVRRTFVNRTFKNEVGDDVVESCLATWWCASCDEKFPTAAMGNMHKRSCAGAIMTSYAAAEQTNNLSPPAKQSRHKEQTTSSNANTKAITVGRPVPGLHFVSVFISC